MKKLVSLVLAAMMALSLCSFAVAEEKPTLKIMNMYQTYNFEDQYAHKKIIEQTGYNVEWHMLPAENADQQLMLQISSGESYDLLFNMSPIVIAQLNEAGLLIPLNDLLEKYGKDMMGNVSDAAWKTTTMEDGTIFALPKENALPLGEDESKYGLQQYGMMFNMDKMKELNLELPTTLDEFYNVCKAYTQATGNPAFTMANNIWEVHSIMPAFELGSPSWYPCDGKIVHRLYHPGLEGYLTFMQKMYAEGLLDPDFPINSAANAKEKFCNGSALCYVSAFFNYDSVASGFAAAGTAPELKFVPGLVQNEGDAPILYRTAGVSYNIAIPTTAEHPEDAMKWLATISQTENFEAIYVGEEGVHHEKRDGEYWPLFPGFNDLMNSDKFVGIPDQSESFKMWQARARKTPTIGASFAQLNERVLESDIRFDWESFAAGKAAVAENSAALGTLIGDTLIKLVVEGGDVAAAIEQLKADCMDEGWEEYQAAYDEFYAEYADIYDWSVSAK